MFWVDGINAGNNAMLKIENEHEKDEVEWNYLVGRIVEEEAIFFCPVKRADVHWRKV